MVNEDDDDYNKDMNAAIAAVSVDTMNIIEEQETVFRCDYLPLALFCS